MTRIRLLSCLIAAVALTCAAAALSSTPKALPAAAKPDAAAKVDPAAARAKQIEHGKFLAVVSGCHDCHTPGVMFGVPDFGRTLSGSDLGWQGLWGTTYARNLTPDLDTGLGRYKEEEIVIAMKSGRRLDGSPMLPPMPWQTYVAYSDADLRAIATYLMSLPAVKHEVPGRVLPGMQPTGSFLTFPAPPAWDVPRPAEAAPRDKR